MYLAKITMINHHLEQQNTGLNIQSNALFVPKMILDLNENIARFV